MSILKASALTWDSPRKSIACMYSPRRIADKYVGNTGLMTAAICLLSCYLSISDLHYHEAPQTQPDAGQSKVIPGTAKNHRVCSVLILPQLPPSACYPVPLFDFLRTPIPHQSAQPPYTTWRPIPDLSPLSRKPSWVRPRVECPLELRWSPRTARSWAVVTICVFRRAAPCCMFVDPFPRADSH